MKTLPSVPATKVSAREFARLEGCDPKQVRRALETGALFRDAAGLLDVSQRGDWRRSRSNSKDAPAGDNSEDNGGDAVPSAKVPIAAAAARAAAGPQSPQMSRLREAVAHKEDYAGKLKELEYRQRAGELIELSLARRVMFDEFRAARDAWLNFPTRYAALIAADIGIEDAGRLAEALTTYVHKQLQQLGGEHPQSDFTAGSGRR